MIWPHQKDDRGESTKINYGMDGVQAALTARNLEPDQWRNREEWRLVSEDGNSC
jgi:hypothetical protein